MVFLGQGRRAKHQTCKTNKPVSRETKIYQNQSKGDHMVGKLYALCQNHYKQCKTALYSERIGKILDYIEARNRKGFC